MTQENSFCGMVCMWTDPQTQMWAKLQPAEGDKTTTFGLSAPCGIPGHSFEFPGPFCVPIWCNQPSTGQMSVQGKSQTYSLQFDPTHPHFYALTGPQTNIFLDFSSGTQPPTGCS